MLSVTTHFDGRLIAIIDGHGYKNHAQKILRCYNAPII